MNRIFAVSALCLFTAPGAYAETIWLPYPQEGIELGQGFNTLDNHKTSSVCVDFIPVEDAGLDVTYEIKELNSFSEVFSALSISASGALNMAVLEATAKLSFANSVRTRTIGEMFAITARVDRGIYYASPTLTSKRGALNVLPEGKTAADFKSVNSISFRKDWTPLNPLFDFESNCGHGFVSAITLGLEINSIVDTSQTNSTETSKLNGSIKLKALGGLISGSGSLSGTSEAESSIATSYLTSFLSGGEKYDLPQTIAEMKTFVKGLPMLADAKPKPMFFAVTPYSELVETENTEAFDTATDLLPITNAFFTARDARDRISYIIDNQQSKTSPELFSIPNEAELFVELSSAYGSMASLHDVLVNCRDTLSTANRKRSVSIAPSASAKSQPIDLAAVYSSIASKAVEERSLRKASALQTDDADSVLNCLSGEEVTSVKKASDDAMLFSIVATPVNLTAIVDPLVPMDVFADSVSVLSKSDVPEKLPQLMALQAESNGFYDQCVAQAWATVDVVDALVAGEPMNDSNPLLSLMLGDCSKEQGVLLDKVATLSSEIPPEEREAFEQMTTLVREVIAREIYRKTFYPMRKSLCSRKMHQPLCRWGYSAALNIIESEISLEKNDFVLMATLMGLSTSTAEPEPTKAKVDAVPKKDHYIPEEPCEVEPSKYHCH